MNKRKERDPSASIYRKEDGYNRGDPRNVSSGDRDGPPPARKPCFVATAVYGNDECEQVEILRAFRSKILLRFSFGRFLVRKYYKYGPQLASALKGKAFLSACLRLFLNGFVKILKASKVTA